ncbi:uncharacterized protein TNCV_646521 [Trichonephila clavipes]|nr:uncharacterized protein TNCV_646521 [Trichonephila clavipes]
MDEILTTARDLELEVNEDGIEELIMGHEDKLTIEELQEILNEEHQETQRNVSPSEQEEDESRHLPLKIFLKGGMLQNPGIVLEKYFTAESRDYRKSLANMYFSSIRDDYSKTILFVDLLFGYPLENIVEKNTAEFRENSIEPIFVVDFKTEVGRGSLVVKVTDSWLTCHKFEPSAAEDPPCLEGRCTR